MSTAVLPRPASPIVAPCTAARYVIDPERTTVNVRLRKVGIPVRGHLTTLGGVIDIPADMTDARVSVTVHAAGGLRSPAGRPHSAPAATLKFDGHGLRPIVHSMITADGDRPLWWLDGRLTVRGVSRPLNLAVGAVHRSQDRQSLEFNATATLRRSEFHVGHFGALVSDVVRVTICGRAQRA